MEGGISNYLQNQVRQAQQIENQTDHDDIIMQNAARKIMDIAIETGMPVSLGITGPGQTRLQAEARIEKARSAVEAVVKMLKANKN